MHKKKEKIEKVFKLLEQELEDIKEEINNIQFNNRMKILRNYSKEKALRHKKKVNIRKNSSNE